MVLMGFTTFGSLRSPAPSVTNTTVEDHHDELLSIDHHPYVSSVDASDTNPPRLVDHSSTPSEEPSVQTLSRWITRQSSSSSPEAPLEVQTLSGVSKETHEIDTIIVKGESKGKDCKSGREVGYRRLRHRIR